MKSLDSLEQNTKHILKLRTGSGWLVQLNMGWLGFGTFQRPTHALVTESRWLLKISVELSVARAINRAGSGNYWKAPISCRRAAASATGLTPVLSCVINSPAIH